jgi:glycosyltransferase involved in cell wall biosynthesis
MNAAPDRVLLFRRDFHGLTGGHLKVRHYFGHAEHSSRFRPRVFFTPESIRGPDNPWHGIEPPPCATWQPELAAALFVAGMDWEAVPDPAPVLVINLIQGVRHADPGDPRRAFLARPATRICVSDEVAEAILATGLVSGPVHVIPNGIDFRDLPVPARRREIPVLIAGAKNPTFARAVAERLAAAEIEADCLLEPLPRSAFLERLARARVALTLPLAREGFFLPALEAMAVGAVVVCPDCIGNRGFCRDDETAFRPGYGLDDVVAATIGAARMSDAAAAAMQAAAAAEVQKHGLEAERLAFLRILDAV